MEVILPQLALIASVLAFGLFLTILAILAG
jgi:hypothetical protein